MGLEIIWRGHGGICIRIKTLDQDVFCSALYLTNFGPNKIEKKKPNKYNHNHNLRSNIDLISRKSKDLL